MLFTILFYVGALGFGQLTLSVLPIRWYAGEIWAARLVLGLFLSTWLLLLCSWLLGYQAGQLAVLLFLAFVNILLFTSRIKSPLVQFLDTPRKTKLWLAVTGFFSLLITGLLISHMLLPGPGGLYSGGPSWGDLPLHLSLISHLAYGQHFSWDFSLLAGSKLTYPLLTDFLTGILVRSGLTFQAALLVSSISLSLSLIQLLFFLGLRLLKSVRAAAIFCALFLLSGSSLGFTEAIRSFTTSGQSFVYFLTHLPHDFSNNASFGFGNFINTILMPQRSFQFGLPLFCLILIILYTLVEKPSTFSFTPFLLIGSLIGLLPLAHTHTFFIAFSILVALTIRQAVLRQTLKGWLLALGLAFLLAAPQLLFQIKGNYHPGFIQFHIGWMLGDFSMPFLLAALAGYVALNFLSVLILAALSYPQRQLAWPIRWLVLFGFAIFIINHIFIFQPSFYDNIKFLIYAYLFFCLAIAQLISSWSRQLKRKWLAYLFFFLMTVTGSIGIGWEAQQHDLLYPSSELKAAVVFRSVLPPDAVVLTSDAHSHPLWSLAGQPVVRGYSFWLWSYGLPVEQLSKDVPLMYAGGPATAALLKQYRVHYVFIGPSERTMYTVNEAYFRAYYPQILHFQDYDIYNITF